MRPNNYNQYVYREMVLGTLVYSLVIGFFADYTNFIEVGTFSTVFLSALVLQLLTFMTMSLKSVVAGKIKLKKPRYYKTTLAFSIWLIMFLSKFVFLWVIDMVFGSSVNINGFVALVVIILSMTLVKHLIDYMYAKLAD